MSRREPIAAGDYLTRLENDHLLVDAPFEKEGWKARLPGAQRKAPYPGSTIRFEDRLFEIETASVQEGRYVYRLIPWDPAFAIRRIFDYGAEEAQQARQERRARDRHEKASGLLILVGPLVGLLPSEDQFRFEAKYSTPAVRNTTLSAILLFVPGFFALYSMLSIGFGGGPLLPESLLSWTPLLLYLSLESMFRGVVSAKLLHPLGSLPVVLPIETYRAIGETLHPERRRKRRDQRDISSRSSLLWSRAVDRVRPLGEEGKRLEITSLLPKPHWTTYQMGIRYRDELYFLTERGTSGEGRQIRHRFVLEEAAPEHVFAIAVDYDPEEVRELHRDAEIEKRRIWAETFAPVWGLLEAPMQEKLKRIYGHEPLKNAKTSALFLIASGGLGVVLAIRNLLTGIGGPSDLLAGILAAFLLVENLDRRRKIRAGIVAASKLGILLRPLARALLLF